MPTLILPPRYTVDTNLIRRAAISAGWEIERLRSWRAEKWLRTADPVLYGEPLFAAVVAKSLGLALLEPSFDWLTGVPEKYLRRNVEYMSLGEARLIRNKAFIKPADDKSFVAKVYNSGSELPDNDILPNTIPVLVSEVVNWSVEFRGFVLNRCVVTKSPYLQNGKLCQASDGSWVALSKERQQASEFFATILADQQVELPPAVVVDIGIIEGSGWAIIEANPAWGSGIYGCDPCEILNVLRRASINGNDFPESDGKWLPQRTC